jgi:hypothetical protein
MSTKAQRVAAGKKGAATRRANAAMAAAAKEHSPDPHEVDQGMNRTTEQDVMQSYGVARDAHDEPWKLPAELDAPKPRDGYTQRWVRIRVGNNEDSKNSMKKFREGWLPRSVETVPAGYAPPTFLHPRLGDVIGVDDLILCEMPIKKAMQRNAYYRSRADRMIQGISSDLRNVDRHGPRIDHSAKTQVTKRRLRVPTDPAE